MSAGELARVDSMAAGRVNSQAIANPASRRRRLFADAPLEFDNRRPWAEALVTSVADLARESELFEIGRATYLDRPLGKLKPEGYPDRTTLMSYVAFSRSLARARLRWLSRVAELIAPESLKQLSEQLDRLSVVGRPIASYRGASRPGVVCLEDAARAASDFIFVRTTRTARQRLFASYDFTSLLRQSPALFRWLFSSNEVLLIRDPVAEPIRLEACDRQGRVNISLEPPEHACSVGKEAYFELAGREWLRDGLRLRVLSGGSRPDRVSEGQSLAILPRWDPDVL